MINIENGGLVGDIENELVQHAPSIFGEKGMRRWEEIKPNYTYETYLFRVNGGSRVNISELVSDIEWSDSMENIGMQFNATIVCNKLDRYMNYLDYGEIGDHIVFMNNNIEIFRGMIISSEKDVHTNSITAVDRAFYLNQSAETKQFNNIRIDKAIKELCAEYGVVVGGISSIDVTVSEVFRGQTVSSIIKDLLQKAEDKLGVEYILEMRKGELHIFEYAEIEIELKSFLADNIEYMNPLSQPTDIVLSGSIDGMKNMVVVYSGSDENLKIEAIAKDQKSIDKFGTLKHIESVSDENIAEAKNIANNKLKELNIIEGHGVISLSQLLNDDRARSGRVVRFENDSMNIKGRYMIKECTHSFSSNQKLMDMTIERIDG